MTEPKSAIERLEALAEFVKSRGPLVAVRDDNQVVQIEPTIRAIIEALKKRDEAVRKVAKEMANPSKLTLASASVGGFKPTHAVIEMCAAWAARLREAVGE